jgi:DNA-directed RNA polymerase subunit H (RpoH/RPB5)
MESHNYINQYKDKETIRLTVLTNICRMLIRRGNLSSEKYMMDNKSTENKIYVSKYDSIDNNKFLRFIGRKDDDNIYKIPLDVPYVNQNLSESKFNGNIVIVKLIPLAVKDVTNSPLLNDFLKTYKTSHKIVVFESISERAYTYVNSIPNSEVFNEGRLMIDLMSHINSPIECSIIQDKDISHFINPKLCKIFENDPLARYYNAKKGNILRIIRPSLSNNIEVGLRRVVDAKPVFG